MLSHFFKQPLFTVITIFGFLLILFGFYQIDDITKLTVSPLARPLYLSIILGVLLMVSGVALHVMTHLSITKFSVSNVKRLTNGFSISHGSFVVNILLGSIETVDCSKKECMIALPANEFFDDDCISDTGSALGAYMQFHFKDSIPKIQSLIKKLLHGEPCEEVEKEPGVFVPSYGVGKCIYIDRPLSCQHRIAMVAVTTKRTNEGLQADPCYIFNAVESIHREMANHRLTRLFVPVLGSGHGGLKGEVSLVCMLIAFSVLHRRRSGHHLQDLNIVVYRRDENSEPSIPEKSIKRILALAYHLLLN